MIGYEKRFLLHHGLRMMKKDLKGYLSFFESHSEAILMLMSMVIHENRNGQCRYSVQFLHWLYKDQLGLHREYYHDH